MVQVGAHDGFDVVLIDTGDAVQKGTEGCFIVEMSDDVGLVGSGYLGIRDNDGGEKRVGSAAFTAAETADTQADESVGGFETAQIIAVDRKAGGMPAGTSELVELEGRNEVIVNVLSQRVAYFNG